MFTSKSSRFCGQAPESAKLIIKESESFDIRRRRICEGKQSVVEGDTGLGYTILELVKFTGVEWPKLEFWEHNKCSLVDAHGAFELFFTPKLSNLVYFIKSNAVQLIVRI